MRECKRNQRIFTHHTCLGRSNNQQSNQKNIMQTVLEKDLGEDSERNEVPFLIVSLSLTIVFVFIVFCQ